MICCDFDLSGEHVFWRISFLFPCPSNVSGSETLSWSRRICFCKYSKTFLFSIRSFISNEFPFSKKKIIARCLYHNYGILNKSLLELTTFSFVSCFYGVLDCRHKLWEMECDVIVSLACEIKLHMTLLEMYSNKIQLSNFLNL